MSEGLIFSSRKMLSWHYYVRWIRTLAKVSGNATVAAAAAAAIRRGESVLGRTIDMEMGRLAWILLFLPHARTHALASTKKNETENSIGREDSLFFFFGE